MNTLSLEGTAANFNSAFYTKVFRAILRMKGNYLWPAMWNNAFTEGRSCQRATGQTNMAS